MKKPLFLLISIAAGILVFFQNCAKVTLEEEPLSEQVNYLAGKVSLCLDGLNSTKTIESIAVYNLNLVNKRGSMELDSDADGVSDKEEALYGFNPLVRHSTGKLLDRICMNLSTAAACASLPVACTQTRNKLGLSDCDYKVLALDQLYANPDHGLDSDKDGMVDLIEILRGTLPNQADNLDDPDHDLILNQDEVNFSSDPQYYDGPPSRFETIARSDKLANDPSCSGERWEFKVAQLPWVKAPAVTDDLDSTGPSGSLSLSHPKNNNVGLMVIKLRPRLGETGYSKILFRRILLGSETPNLNGTMADFETAGEVEP